MPRPIDMKICKACVSNGTKNGWNSWDELALIEGKVFCPPVKTLVSIVHPELCRCQLEYMMLDGKKLCD